MRNWVGQQIGNYIIRQPIGDGGSASVYLGQHIKLQNMQAAIKILQTHLSEKEIEAFRREADTIAALRHPNIVPLLDFDIRQNPLHPSQQVPFLVMPYYPKGTLRNRHPTGSQVPLALVLHYVEQTTLALQYAHDHRMIHRDVKPENMLVGENHEIVLSDFGIASIAHSVDSVKTELPIGTFAYMAPEQFEGRPQRASDQYALAVIAYEWLSGTRPFTGGYESLIYQHFHSTPPSLLEKVPTLPIEVEYVIFTALSKDPAARFGSIRAFANAITAAANPGVSQAPTILSASMELLALHQQQTPPIRESAARSSASAKTPILPETQRPRQGRRRRIIQITSLIALVLLLLSALSMLGVNYIQGRSSGANATATALANSLQQQNATTVAQAVQATTSAQKDATATEVANINAQATANVASSYPYPSYLPGKGMLKSVYVSAADFQDWNYSVDYAKSTLGGCGMVKDAIYVKSTTTGSNACKYPDTIDDFALEVNMTIIKGDFGEIYFRATSELSAYVLAIRPDGSYIVLLVPDANRANWAILGEGTHPAIKKGLNQTNLIAIYAKGRSLQVFVNSQSIFRTENRGLSEGGIYFVAESFEAQETEVAFAQIKIWQL